MRNHQRRPLRAKPDNPQEGSSGSSKNRDILSLLKKYFGSAASNIHKNAPKEVGDYLTLKLSLKPIEAIISIISFIVLMNEFLELIGLLDGDKKINNPSGSKGIYSIFNEYLQASPGGILMTYMIKSFSIGYAFSLLMTRTSKSERESVSIVSYFAALFFGLFFTHVSADALQLTASDKAFGAASSFAITVIILAICVYIIKFVYTIDHMRDPYVVERRTRSLLLFTLSAAAASLVTFR
ncbi:hypothetical protein [Roseibium sp.]|uniref:hypothetical protein n=1 Tax=Roseibium sp. TaxID=1936156 RepID=UPI003A983B91